MVNKSTLIFFLILFSGKSLFSQDCLYEVSEILTNDHSVHGNANYSKSSLLLTLSENGEYNLILSNASYGWFDEVYSTTQISYGTYSYSDNVLLLYDAPCGFVMEMAVNSNKQLTATKGLSIIQGKTFFGKNDKGFPTAHFLTRIVREETVQTQMLAAGRYMNREDGSFELVVQDDHRYEYFIDGFLISAGSWSQKENVLLFQDDGMDTPFYANNSQISIVNDFPLANIKLFPLYLVSDNNSFLYYGRYQIDVESDQVSCELVINPDHTYELLLEIQETNNTVFCTTISKGHFNSFKEQLILHDDFCDLEMELSISNYVIKMEHGFSFLDGKKVVNFNSEVTSFQSLNDDFSLRLKRDINLQKSKPVSIGQYEDQDQRYSLIINGDGSYQLLLKDILLSEGLWRQQENSLFLRDYSLDIDFVVIHENGTLISSCIPGDFGGAIFKLR